MKLLNKIALCVFIIFLICLIKTTCFATTAIVNTDTLKLRKEASTDSIVLELLSQDEEIEVIEESGDWYKVEYNKIIGFVHKDYIKMKEETTSNDNNQDSDVDNNVNNTDNSTDVTNDENKTEETFISANTSAKLLKNTGIYILPLINSNIISNANKDSEVTIISRANGWYYIQSQDTNGWIRKECLVETEQSTTEQTSEIQNNQENQNNEQANKEEINENAVEEKAMYINSPSVYVRKGPATTYEVVDSLILNNQVTVIAESGDWYKVKVDGKEGYIAKRLLSNTSQEETSRGNTNRPETTEVEENEEQTSNNSTGEEIANFARDYLGCRYVYGASGPSTFDCSGFTMYVYKNFGISLSHSATAQSKYGSYVSKDELEAGDLVFFTDYETGAGIGHVGIYIGNGNFIHASSGTGYCVKISTLLEGSYYNRYETARRLV